MTSAIQDPCHTSRWRNWRQIGGSVWSGVQCYRMRTGDAAVYQLVAHAVFQLVQFGFVMYFQQLSMQTMH